MKEIEDIQKKNPFKVPDGYFESLTERTMVRIKESDLKSSDREKAKPFRIRPAAFLALAAAIVGFAVISTVMVRLFSDKSDDMQQLYENDIYSEVITNEIDTYLIENELSMTSLLVHDEETLTDETIIEYLLLENIEISDIYDLL